MLAEQTESGPIQAIGQFFEGASTVLENIVGGRIADTLMVSSSGRAEGTPQRVRPAAAEMDRARQQGRSAPGMKGVCRTLLFAAATAGVMLAVAGPAMAEVLNQPLGHVASASANLHESIIAGDKEPSATGSLDLRNKALLVGDPASVPGAVPFVDAVDALRHLSGPDLAAINAKTAAYTVTAGERYRAAYEAHDPQAPAIYQVWTDLVNGGSAVRSVSNAMGIDLVHGGRQVAQDRSADLDKLVSANQPQMAASLGTGPYAPPSR